MTWSKVPPPELWEVQVEPVHWGLRMKGSPHISHALMSYRQFYDPIMYNSATSSQQTLWALRKILLFPLPFDRFVFESVRNSLSGVFYQYPPFDCIRSQGSSDGPRKGSLLFLLLLPIWNKTAALLRVSIQHSLLPKKYKTRVQRHKRVLHK